MDELAKRFPIGDAITMANLDDDPYPIYRDLRASEPVTWWSDTGMYLVTRHDDVQQVLRDTETFIVGTERSTLMDTFGVHMLTSEGEEHNVYKRPLLPLFRPLAVKERLEAAVKVHVDTLIDGFRHRGSADLREVFAARLPILTMLSLFGLPLVHEQLLRAWYDSFERALANFTWDEEIRQFAKKDVEDFHGFFQTQIDIKRRSPDDSLLSQMLQNSEPRLLSDEEVRRNALIIFFGGISTVEALILNSLVVLVEHGDLLRRLQVEPDSMNLFLDEVVRWSGPVQSATRTVTKPTALRGVELRPGDTVNCMLGAANHDPDVFERPELFDMDRVNLRSHIGFAIGSHHCLGSHLAKLEAGLAVGKLINALPNLMLKPGTDAAMRGHEFRQPSELLLTWDAGP